MKISKFHFIALTLSLGLAACSGGGQNGGANPTNNSQPTTSGSTPTTGNVVTPAENKDTPVEGAKTVSKGTRGKPNLVASTKEMLPHHFYNVAGFKVCSTGTAEKDVNKKTLFVNIAGASEECGSDPKKEFTIIIRMSVVKSKSLAVAKGGKITQGVVFPQKDLGNDRLVAFITEDVSTGKFKF
ncbi:MAG: hypothetical protein K8R69_00085 [Deltaproteobacteria bacterium]|nr:hypothetical protein [Deltaproteobacteria bacterium]